MAYDNYLIYATYTVLYANDTACNAVLELEKYMEGMDKESKKIYGALKKRALGYIRFFNNLANEYSWFTSDYFSIMDDYVGSNVDDMYVSIEDYLISCGAENVKLYAKLEQVRMLCHIAVSIHTLLYEQCVKYRIKTYSLKSYRLGELQRVVDNLSDWVDRYFKSKKICVMSDNKELINIMHKVNQSMMSFDNFNEAYKFSCENINKKHE